MRALSPVESPVFTEGSVGRLPGGSAVPRSFCIYFGHPAHLLFRVMRSLELVALYLVTSRYAPSSLLPASERERRAFFPLAWCRGRRTLVEGERGVSRTRGTVLGVKRLLANLQRANLKNSGAF